MSPVDAIPPVPPVAPTGTGNTANPVSESFALYEAELANQDLQGLLAIGSSASGSGLSNQVNVGLQDADLLSLNPAALQALTGVNTTSGSGAASNSNLTVQQEITEYATTQALMDIGESSAAGFSVQVDIGVQNSDLLNLSPAALNVLNTVEGNAPITSSTVPLTPTQLQQISGILTQFANAPFDQATFAQIQAALTAAGIDPSQITLQEILQGALAVQAPFSFLNEDLITESEIVEEELTNEVLES